MADVSSRSGLSTIGRLWRGHSDCRLLLLVVAAPALAAGVNLAWDPVLSPPATGYKIYYGPSVGNYPSQIDVGNTTTYTVTGLTEGATYHFVVTAYDAGYTDSGYSNDVGTTVPYSVPVAQFTGSPTSGTFPLTVNFSNTSTGTITSYAWTFGDGGTSTAGDPEPRVRGGGNLHGETHGDRSGRQQCADAHQLHHGVHAPPPVAQFTGSPTSGTAPLTVIFSNTSTGSITGYAWTFGDGGTSTIASPSHVYCDSGNVHGGPDGHRTRRQQCANA